MFTSVWRKPTFPIAIDLGAYSVKVLQLASGGGATDPLACDQRILPPHLKLDSADYHQAVAEAVKDMLRGQRFRGKQVITSLPCSVVTFKNLRLPPMPDSEMAAAVEWEAQQLLGDKARPMSTQYLDAGQVRQGDQLRREIILMAAPTDFVQQHADSLSSIDLRLQAIETAPGALARWLCQTQPAGEPGQATVAIDVGYHTTKVLIVRDQSVCFFKLIEIAGRDLDRAIAEALNIEPAHVIDVCQQAASGDNEDVRRAIVKALRQPVDELASEIGLCLRYYSVTFRGQRPVSAVLTGGVAQWPWLPEMLSEPTGLAMSQADWPARAPNRATFALAMGSSLRRPQTQEKRGAA